MYKNLPFVIICVITSYSSYGLQHLDSLENKLKTADGEERINTLNELFIVYNQLDPARAFEYSKQALDLADEINYKKGKAAALNNMGVVYKNQGAYDDALEYYIESLRISDKAKDQKALASTMNNIGTVYSLKGTYDKALIYFLASYDIFKELGNEQKLIGALNNIGNAYSHNGRKDKALEYFSDAIDLSNKLGLSNSVSDPLNNIGNIFFYRENYIEAMDYYKRSLEVEKQNKNLMGQALALSNLGSVNLELDNFEEAERCHLEAETIAISVGIKPILTHIYEGLSKIYAVNKDYKKAYEIRLKYDKVKDYVFNEESSLKLAQLEVAAELQKKEKELEILKQQEKITALQIENSRIVILLGLMGAIILVAVGIIIYKLRTTSSI